MNPCEPVDVIDFALPKWQSDPNIRIDDAYKWIFQATRGGEHMAPSREGAAKALEIEWTDAEPAADVEAMWEPLCPCENIGRLNIRPFRDLGGQRDDLVEAFLTSSRSFTARPDALLSSWNELGHRLERQSSGALNHGMWSLLNAALMAKSYPAIHHSTDYRAARRPSYRILTTGALQPLLGVLQR
jgi:hypothetical protein